MGALPIVNISFHCCLSGPPPIEDVVYFWLVHTCTAGQSGPTHASFQKYRFHVMIDFCCACLTMWLGGADLTRLWWGVISEWLYNVPWLGICLSQGLEALQRLVFKWCIIFRCRRHVLAPGPWGDMLRFPYWELPETLQCIYPLLILLKPSHLPAHMALGEGPLALLSWSPVVPSVSGPTENWKSLYHPSNRSENCSEEKVA